jgi:HAE1 family hydrophobic/amphiphilic exporter-1
MVISAIVVFGLVAYNSLGVDLFPKVDFPVVTVTTILPGADPETIETDVTERLEESLNTISGIKSLRSQSSESVSIVIIEFELERDVDEAAQDVRDKVSNIRRDLPDDVEPPIIQKMDPDAAPIMAVALSGSRSIRELTEYADDVVKERLERVNGVGSVEIVGGREREIRVWISMDRLSAYNLSVDDVVRALTIENLEVPGGRIETGPREIVVRTRGRIQHPEDFDRIVVAQRPTGPIYLQDVALVEDGMADERSLSRLNGERAVSLLIRRQSGTNAVAVAHEIKNALLEIEDRLPEEFSMVLADDSSEYIEENINDVKFHLIFGGSLAVLVIFFFLRNVTTTLISAVAIPTSIIGTFYVLDWFDFSLNMLTMLALSLSVGILIDDAIVVIENIFRHMEEGRARRDAADFATSEIGLAVMATTFSIVAVFIPVAFMEGLIGRFFYQFGITVAFAVLISLFVSFTLTPMLSSQFLGHQEQHGIVYRTIERWLDGLDRKYRNLLAWALRHRWTVVSASVGCLLLSFFLVRFIGTEFLPEADQSQFNVIVRADPGWSLDATDRVVKEAEAIVRIHPAVENVFTTIGGGSLEKVNQATILTKLVDPGDRDQTQRQIMNQIRQELSSIRDVRISVERVSRISGAGSREAELQVNVRGPKTASLEELVGVTDSIVAELAKTQGLVDLDTTFEKGKPQVSILIDRNRASDLGINAASLGTAVRLLVGGDEITKYQEGGKQFDVRVRLVESDRNDPRRMEALPLRARTGETVQLGNIARIVDDTGPTQIDHQARQRQITILANLQGKPLGTAIQDVNAIVERVGLPEGFAVDFEGMAEMMGESFRNLAFALFLAVILIYMVLASQFGSFVHPLTIMLSLPMSLVGAIGALLLAGHTISIFALIGIIMLMGLVTKNAILLVDYSITLRERDGMERTEALLKAGPVRLRPILMTTAAMVFGMLPIALGLGAGGSQRAPMAVTVIGGLITSTLLTLVLVPVVYTLMDDLTRVSRRKSVPTRAVKDPQMSSG